MAVRSARVGCLVMTTMNRIGLVIGLLAICPGLVHASGTGQGRQVLSRWKTMDSCTRQAQKAFPDFTAERDAALKACLSANNLPPREDISPPAPAAGK
jgi:hypothetical protein